MTKTPAALVVMTLSLLLAACSSKKASDDIPAAPGEEPGLPGQSVPTPGSDAGAGAGAGGPSAALCSVLACSGLVADFCCPASCDAASDVDCPGCGNRILEPGETCDPLESCPAACPAQGCAKRRLKGAGTCSAVCVDEAPETACLSNDGCCPAGCNAGNDNDCTAVCGNGALEPGETCDPLGSCPTSCPMKGCTVFELRGAGTCSAECVAVPGQEVACRNGDGCCPRGCTGENDSECRACGNGVKDPGEQCDPLTSCPTSCPAQGCRLRRLVDQGTCSAQCVDGALQTACVGGDGCCPASCDANTDSDCKPRCGNSRVEPGERCDPVSECDRQQALCVDSADRDRTPRGDASQCTFHCEEAARACGPADGACPAGCGPTQDPDCAGCGNGRLDRGESCDPPSACRQQQQACTSDQNTLRTGSGNPDQCTFRCTAAPRQCVPGDMICPAACGPATDADCAGCGNGRLEGNEACDPVAACEKARADCTGDARMPTGKVEDCSFRCVDRPCGPSDGVCPSPNCTNEQDRDCKLPDGSRCSVARADQCRVLCLDGHCCAAKSCPRCYGCGSSSDGSCTPLGGGDDPDPNPENACTGASTCNADNQCVPKLRIEPPTLDFSVALGNEKRLTVINQSHLPSGVLTVTLNDQNGRFAIKPDGCSGETLAGVGGKGNSCVMAVHFNGGRPAGTFTAELHVMGGAGGVATAKLSGTAIILSTPIDKVGEVGEVAPISQ